MKTISHIPHSAVLSGPILSVLVFSVVASSHSTAAPDTTATEPKTHTLFMGVDLDLKVNNDFCRVRDVSGDSFVVSASGSEQLVPMNKGLINLKVQQSLKLTEASATITNLKGERAYTPANDPTKKFMRQAASGQDLADLADGFSLEMSGSLGVMANNKDPHQAGVAASAQAGMGQPAGAERQYRPCLSAIWRSQ